MIAIPSELITLFASSFFGGVMRGWSRRLENQELDRLLHLKLLKNDAATPIRYATLTEGYGVNWTRRSIAMMASFFIIVFPKLVAIFWPEIPLHIGYTEATQSFFGFITDLEKLKWVSLKGIVMTPLDTHILSAIIGLYFGGSLMGRS